MHLYSVWRRLRYPPAAFCCVFMEACILRGAVCGMSNNPSTLWAFLGRSRSQLRYCLAIEGLLPAIEILITVSSAPTPPCFLPFVFPHRGATWIFQRLSRRLSPLAADFCYSSSTRTRPEAMFLPDRWRLVAFRSHGGLAAAGNKRKIGQASG